MAQYLMSVLTDAPELATEDEMAAIDAFNEQLVAAVERWPVGGVPPTPGA